MRQASFAFLLSMLFNIHAGAQDSMRSARIAYAGATLHKGTGVVIQNAFLVFENGKIMYAGENYNFLNTDSIRIDLKGKHIYPGFIALNSTLGLNEIDAVRATLDYNEVGQVNPNVRSIIAYNTDSRIIPTVRSNGILLTQVTPQGGLVSGTSSVMMLHGWNWEDAAYKADDGIHVNWPRVYYNTGWWAEPGDVRWKDNLEEMKRLEKLFGDAKGYYEAGPSSEINLQLESMKGLFDSSKTFYVHVDYVKGIISAIGFAQKYGLKLAIVGGADSWMITELLKEKKVPVILTNIHRLPERSMEDADLPFKLPFLLNKAGILFAIAETGSWEQRNLMFQAGTAAAYGLTREEAIMAITLNSAKILGIDKTTGSLETGKDATFFISSGDALDMRTLKVEAAFIKGVPVDLNNQQIELYKKFSRKYGLTPH